MLEAAAVADPRIRQSVAYQLFEWMPVAQVVGVISKECAECTLRNAQRAPITHYAGVGDEVLETTEIQLKRCSSI